MTSVIYIGMDVHKNTYSLCAVDETCTVLKEDQIDAKAELIQKFVRKLRSEFGEDIAVLTGYEAGVLGYSLYNELASLEIDCEILAPTTMYRSTKNKVVKNDRRDAKMIASNLANNTYKAVYIPDSGDVDTKEYLRMRIVFKKNLKRVKQNISSLVLRHGLRYPGKTPWTKGHIEWLKKIDWSPLLRETLDEYLIEYDRLLDKIAQFDSKIEELSHQERYAESVGKLRTLKGVDTMTAMTIQVEISDFNRFASPTAFASYLGLTPSEESSGGKVRQGAITKQGNVVVRTALIEAARALVKGKVGYKSKKLKARQKGQDSHVIAYADRAATRLQKRYMRMIFNGKLKNVAITALARELACFVWGIEVGAFE